MHFKLFRTVGDNGALRTSNKFLSEVELMGNYYVCAVCLAQKAFLCTF